MTQHFLSRSLVSSWPNKILSQLLPFVLIATVSACTSPGKNSELKQELKSEPSFSLGPTQNLPLIPHPDWLGHSLQFAAFDQLRVQVENRELSQKQIQHSLKNRGEAHITILTPPEFAGFQGRFPMAEIEKIAEPMLKNLEWKALCVGRGSLSTQPQVKTYFVVLQSPGLLQLREKIKAEALRHGTGQDFKPSDFYPHVTLGFTERDLHLQDGVKKDQNSCLYPL